MASLHSVAFICLVLHQLILSIVNPMANPRRTTTDIVAIGTYVLYIRWCGCRGIRFLWQARVLIAVPSWRDGEPGGARRR